ncbi:MAG: restriction endonuclease [Candidatus Bathyarchaeota archaeon]|nr:restriction endonuclease [Candidatus Bathyarchaeum tardum]WGM88565.1 MAG: restriction endonuclease [Candidatus Bathyarchaeum tardum]WNZ29168.1 MAG: restriction endonuclease [Candidatus Bathyarchaeota archaeon]
MTTQTDVIITLLKYTTDKPVVKQIVSREAKVPVQVANNILNGLYEHDLIEYDNEQIELSSSQRVKLALYAINQGTDVEQVCKVLEWKEFENFVAKNFEKNNFVVKRNFRFKAAQRRWEIDVVAHSEPIIVSVDCKRWRRGWGNSSITRVAAEQAQRTQALANSFDFMQKKLGLNNWTQATLFPAILSLFPGPVKFYNKVPVVPILQLQNFVDEFLGHQKELVHFRANLGPKISDYSEDNT